MKHVLLLFFVFSFCLAERSHADSESHFPVGDWAQANIAGVEFWIYTPLTDAKTSSAVMISLHGCAQTADMLKTYANWASTADKNNMIVILPRVPGGGVYFGCWDYYGPNHDDHSGHSGAIVRLTQALMKAPGLRIDPSRVFISGLSSGAGEAAVIGCLRPDLFSGVGLSSGPLIGTGLNDLSQPHESAGQAADVCRTLAGSRAPLLAKQKISLINADIDNVVAPIHSSLAAKAMSEVTGASVLTNFDLSQLEGANLGGRGYLYSTPEGVPKISWIVNNGIGHAWPSGTGRADDETTTALFGASYVNGYSVNYPAYLAKFFLASP